MWTKVVFYLYFVSLRGKKKYSNHFVDDYKNYIA